ncbi:uncharacterized protein K452DRAFT_313720 [Aplosporella prunicola CBS 121167]|uniref:Uncharacterized protein n=1 Tax=Aplosporella prunicola CBS 121167 TaxID=1176127 RepID=A0A6A6AXU2_9PEZI|nr:uncharacterized protein K452DRAFT_313720 [Aplosporella prunicola CBS 121167]KAF2135784.1 hypothetical protein K452DRAFT_313720 [Aplosporella prunicola CBS 121167]
MAIAIKGSIPFLPKLYIDCINYNVKKRNYTNQIADLDQRLNNLIARRDVLRQRQNFFETGIFELELESINFNISTLQRELRLVQGNRDLLDRIPARSITEAREQARLVQEARLRLMGLQRQAGTRISQRQLGGTIPESNASGRRVLGVIFFPGYDPSLERGNSTSNNLGNNTSANTGVPVPSNQASANTGVPVPSNQASANTVVPTSNNQGNTSANNTQNSYPGISNYTIYED